MKFLKKPKGPNSSCLERTLSTFTMILMDFGLMQFSRKVEFVCL